MIDYAMRQVIGNDALDLGFKLDRKRSRRLPTSCSGKCYKDWLTPKF